MRRDNKLFGLAAENNCYRVYEKNSEEQQVPFEGLVAHLHYQDVAQQVRARRLGR